MTPDIPTETDDLQIPAEQWPAVAQRVRAFYASDRTTHATGVAVSYADRPTVAIRQDDGRLIHWVADLCEPIADKPDSPPPGGSGIARDAEAEPEPGGHNVINYLTQMRAAHLVLKSAGLDVDGSYRADNADLAARIESLRDERDEAQDERAKAHGTIEAARAALLEAYREADDADRELAVAWDLPELAAQVVAIERVRALTEAEPVQESADDARTIKWDGRIWYSARAVDELVGQAGKGREALEAAKPSDDALAKAHNEGYHEGRRDGAMSSLSDMRMEISRRIGEA